MMNVIRNSMLNTRLLAFLLAAFGVIVSAGCSSFPSENPDPAKNNKATYNKELKECQEDYPEAASGAYIRQWISCMRLKGWK
jgi:hypothetical protein